jgi:ADP-ribose pyrophosphatase YjhB (NUDIX family)
LVCDEQGGTEATADTASGVIDAQQALAGGRRSKVGARTEESVPAPLKRWSLGGKITVHSKQKVRMNRVPEPLTPAEQITHWADKLRDLSATGLQYAPTVYDRERYEFIQNIAIEMFAFATTQSVEDFVPLKSTLFSRLSPLVAGTAAVIDEKERILLMRRSDNHLWVTPGGVMEVGETPAEAVVRETLEETGIRCHPIALVGIYDSRIWDIGRTQHIYKFTFLCEPDGQQMEPPSHANETSETGWFENGKLPDDLYEGHFKRIHDAFRVRSGDLQAYFDLHCGSQRQRA